MDDAPPRIPPFPAPPPAAPASDWPDARLLVVDDEAVNLALLRALLARAGYGRVETLDDPGEAVERLRNDPPDLLITDLRMPRVSGLDLLDALRGEAADGGWVPVLMITADGSEEAEVEALRHGANDFLHKPFRSHQIRLRVRNLLHARRMHLALHEQNRGLEQRVRERTVELETARVDSLERLALAAEYRDYDTGRHTQRVGALAALLAERLGLPPEQVDLILLAAPLHDVGKIGIPDDILLKPGRLTAEEFEVMKRHIQVGVDLLSHGHSDTIRMAETIARAHHERWDGSGYPEGLAGEEIPLPGRIVAVADVFDTLVNRRPYKPAWPVERAVAEIRAYAGTWFDPRVVGAFLRVLGEHPDLLGEIERRAVSDPRRSVRADR